MKKHIPNTLTCANLVSGCIATYFAFQGEYHTALYFIIIGAVFDFFDGFAARLLHVSSAIGKELDSLADDVTFGFAPAAIVFMMLRQVLEEGACPSDCPLAACGITEYIPYLAFLIAAFSALRLAKFNLDERQTTSFIGLPTPANALFWAAIGVALHESGLIGEAHWLAPALLVGVIVSCWLLVAEIPMFALKFKTYGLKGNELRYGFIVCSAVLLGVAGWVGFAAVIVLYVLTSLISNAFGTKIAEEE